MATQAVWPLNENGEIVFSAGTGSGNVAGYLSQDVLPSADDGSVPVTIRGYNSVLKASQIRAVALGDSITQANNTVVGSAGGSWFEFFCSASGQSFTRVNNAGVGGNTSTMMLSRFDTDVTPYKPDVVFLMAGTNDVSQSFTKTVSMGNFTNIKKKCDAINAQLVVLLIAPRNDRTDETQRFNSWIREFALNNDVLVYDVWGVSRDPATGGWKAGLSVDGVHPNQAAQAAAGLELWKQVPQLTYTLPQLPNFNTDTLTQNSAIRTNILFLTDSNSDGTPDGWGAYGASSTRTLTAATYPVIGNQFNLAVSGITSIAVCERTINTPINVGDIVRVVFKLKTNNVVSGNGKFSVRIQSSSSERIGHSDVSADVDGVMYVEFKATTSSTSFNCQIVLDRLSTSSAASYSVSVAQWQVYIN